MTCDAILPPLPTAWVDDKPFMLWDIGPRCVLDHWMDHLFRINANLRLWIEAPDDRLYAYVGGTFPLNRRVQIQAGPPTSQAEACTFFDAKGNIIIRKGRLLTPCMPRQPATKSWFAMVQNWLAELQAAGSQTPELEKQASPGVFIGHHCDISKDTVFQSPCWIGNGCTIRSATIGPNTVLGADCIVHRGATLIESYLMPKSSASPGSQWSGLVVGSLGAIDHQTGCRMELP